MLKEFQEGSPQGGAEVAPFQVALQALPKGGNYTLRIRQLDLDAGKVDTIRIPTIEQILGKGGASTEVDRVRTECIARLAAAEEQQEGHVTTRQSLALQAQAGSVFTTLQVSVEYNSECAQETAYTNDGLVDIIVRKSGVDGLVYRGDMKRLDWFSSASAPIAKSLSFVMRPLRIDPIGFAGSKEYVTQVVTNIKGNCARALVLTSTDGLSIGCLLYAEGSLLPYCCAVAKVGAEAHFMSMYSYQQATDVPSDLVPNYVLSIESNGKTAMFTEMSLDNFIIRSDQHQITTPVSYHTVAYDNRQSLEPIAIHGVMNWPAELLGQVEIQEAPEYVASNTMSSSSAYQVSLEQSLDRGVGWGWIAGAGCGILAAVVLVVRLQSKIRA